MGAGLPDGFWPQEPGRQLVQVTGALAPLGPSCAPCLPGPHPLAQNLPVPAPLATPPNLLQGRQVPDADSVVLGHGGQLPAAVLGGQAQHRRGVGTSQHVVFPGRDVQEAQVARGGGGQHTQTIRADAHQSDGALVLCGQGDSATSQPLPSPHGPVSLQPAGQDRQFPHDHWLLGSGRARGAPGPPSGPGHALPQHFRWPDSAVAPPASRSTEEKSRGQRRR